MKLTEYVIFLLFLANFFAGIGFYKNQKVHVLLSDTALSPSIHFRNCKSYIESGEFDRGIGQLEAGIAACEQIHSEVDSVSRLLLDSALSRLQLVRNEVESDTPHLKALNQACVEVLLALTHAQVIYAKQRVLVSEDPEARSALVHAMSQVKAALLLSEGNKKHSEVEIYSLMNDMVKDYQNPLRHSLSLLDTIDQSLVDLEISFLR